MTTLMPIDKVLTDKRLLGASLDMSTRQTWTVVWKAAYALPMSDPERGIFDQIAGGRTPPSRRVREVWIDAGRRSGKSEEAAAAAIHSALFVKHQLSRGQKVWCCALLERAITRRSCSALSATSSMPRQHCGVRSATSHAKKSR